MADAMTFGPGEMMRCPGHTYQGRCGKGLGWVGAGASVVVSAGAHANPRADLVRKCGRCQAMVSLQLRLGEVP